MEQFSLAAAVSTALIFLLSGCGETLSGDVCDQMHFATLDVETVTEIRLHKTNGPETDENEVSSLSTPSEISAVYEFLVSRDSDWVADPFGVPVGTYRVVFWNNETRLGDVAFGPSFFEGQGCGYFFASDASEDEIRTFVSLLGVNNQAELDF